MEGIKSLVNWQQQVRAIAVLCALTFLFGGALSAEAQQPKPTAKPRTTKPATSVPAPKSEPDLASPPGNLTTPAAVETVQKPPAPTAVPNDLPSFEPATPSELALGYPIGVGDVVRVVVYQQPDMHTETRVSEAGTITVPLLGPVLVAGVTAKRAEDRVAQLLRNGGFVRTPQVNVTVVQFKSRQVSVLGLVSHPGRYSLEEGIYRLTDVLAMAGGALPDSADTVTLIRLVNGKSQKSEVDLPSLFRSGDFSANPTIMAGDSIYVARALQFYIYGEVNRPGAFRLEKDMTLMQALSMGGGVTLRGTEKNIQIRRRDAHGQYTTLKGALTDIVQANDVIFVRESLF